LGVETAFLRRGIMLVMTQIALSMMLLFGAGSFLRGALKAGGLSGGFESRDGVIAEMDFTLGNTDERPRNA
jgi:hypothetical protein